MAITVVLVINRSGGLIYHRDFADRARLSSNEYLILAGTLHGIHLLAAQISPVKTDLGFKLLTTPTTSIYTLHTRTGLKLVLVSTHDFEKHADAARRILDVYTDYALKNPFYALEMPIRADLFDLNLKKVVDEFNK